MIFIEARCLPSWCSVVSACLVVQHQGPRTRHLHHRPTIALIPTSILPPPDCITWFTPTDTETIESGFQSPTPPPRTQRVPLLSQSTTSRTGPARRTVAEHGREIRHQHAALLAHPSRTRALWAHRSRTSTRPRRRASRARSPRRRRARWSGWFPFPSDRLRRTRGSPRRGRQGRRCRTRCSWRPSRPPSARRCCAVPDAKDSGRGERLEFVLIPEAIANAKLSTAQLPADHRRRHRRYQCPDGRKSQRQGGAPVSR